MRAWLSLDRFSGTRPFWPWVATIARRLCIDQRRRSDRETSNLHVAAAVNDRPTLLPDEIVETDEEYRAVLAALRRLKPSEQRVITMRDLHGWSYEEIARFEGVTVESIRGALKRARGRLRESYAKIASGTPAMLGLGALRRLRLRLGRASDKLSMATIGPVPTSLGLVSEVAVRVVVVALGLGTMTAPINVSTVARPAGESPPPGAPRVSAESTMRPSGSGSDDHGGSVAPSKETGSRPGSGALPTSPLPSDGGNTPEDVTFESVSPSPSYASDGTLFAGGAVTRGCLYVVCHVLFRSTDRGRTWHRLGGAGFEGGQLLLPAAYPADGRVFAAGPTGLLLSEDGGNSFRPVAGIAGSAAISPAFSDGDPRILFGATPGWEYRDDVRATKPGGVILPSTSLSGTVAFAPTYPRDPRILVGGTTVSGANRSASAVFLCRNGICDSTAVLPGRTGAATVLVSPRYHLDDTVVAWRPSGLFASRDGGVTFAQLPMPAGDEIADVVFDGAGLVVLMRSAEDGGFRSRLVRSVDMGVTWADLGARMQARSLAGIEVLPDGRILAAKAAEAGGGLLCSDDGGMTWRARCA